MAKKLRKLGAVSVVLMSCLAAVAAGACVALFSSPATARSHRIATVTDNSSFACSTATEWHFIMTDLTSPSQAARKVRVRWSNGRESDVALDGVSDGIGHYYSSAHRTSMVTQLTAIVPIGWTGGLKLFTAPVGACTGSYTYTRAADGQTDIRLRVKAGNTEIECSYRRHLDRAPEGGEHGYDGEEYRYREEYPGFGHDVRSCLASTFGAASVGTLRSCLVGVVGASAVDGRFGYSFSNTIASERVTKNTLSNSGTPPFTSIDTGALVPRWGETLPLGSSTIKWSFAGIDDLGVTKGTEASPLTVNLPARNTVVTTSNKCPYVPPSGCRQGSLSSAADNNILIRGNADVAGLLAGGRLAVQGDITGSTWQAGRDLANVPARIDAAVNGNNRTASGHTPNGSMAIAGTVRGSMHASGSIRTETTPSIPVDLAWATEASQVWGETAATAPVVVIDSTATNKTIRLEGDDPLVNVFTITAAVLGTVKDIQVRIPSNALAIVNVTGSSYSGQAAFKVSFWNGGTYVHTPPQSSNPTADMYRTHVAWNFPTATTVNLSGVTIDGAVLAPKAAMSSNGAKFSGSVIADTLVSAGTTSAFAPALRCAPLPPGGVVPDPSPTTTTSTTTTTTVVGPTTTTTVDPTTTTTTTTDPIATTSTTTTVVVSGVTPPGLGVCYEGVVGQAATAGRFGYITNSTVSAGNVTTSTVNVAGYAAPFTRMGVAGSDWVWSVPFNLQAGPLTWTFDGQYDDGGDFPSSNVSLGAIGQLVTDLNVCDGGLLSPATTLGACYAASVGSVATTGRFWYRTDYTIDAAGVITNTVDPAAITTPFAVLDVDGGVRTESGLIDLAATDITWTFDGVDAVAHRTGTLTASLAATGHIVAAGERCGSDIPVEEPTSVHPT